jgi:hypothetical protein
MLVVFRAVAHSGVGDQPVEGLRPGSVTTDTVVATVPAMHGDEPRSLAVRVAGTACVPITVAERGIAISKPWLLRTESTSASAGDAVPRCRLDLLGALVMTGQGRHACDSRATPAGYFGNARSNVVQLPNESNATTLPSAL